MYVCVCVDHLNRCKTSIRWFRCTTCLRLILQVFPISIFTQGARGHMDGTGQRRPIHDVVQTYLQFSNFHFRNGDRPSQEPACRISNRLSNQFWFLPVRFSQSDLLLTSSDGTVASSKDVERLVISNFVVPFDHAHVYIHNKHAIEDQSCWWGAPLKNWLFFFKYIYIYTYI